MHFPCKQFLLHLNELKEMEKENKKQKSTACIERSASVSVHNQHSSFYKCQNSYHGMEWARMIVDKFMTIFPASFVLVSSVLFCYCFRLEPRCLGLVDMPYHNFINEIFFYDFWTEIHECGAEKLRKVATSCAEKPFRVSGAHFSLVSCSFHLTRSLSPTSTPLYKSTFSFNSFYICHTCESCVELIRVECVCLLALLHIFCHSFE